ncbi:MAG: glycine cleavage system protein R [Pseudomonadales bacterium]|uniref:Glycine cleavage system transcriptional repressor n=1 Tax=Oleiphilus messinensis TaxID=141451 RepID=A0A1Y0I840_9GAMM|nr:glycine cleavage system protein R [Oleiphilus messinensis]ARU56621.1 glycine cleavage system regulatory protein [Oleiphilus messinensis]MCG8611246.1 glycine cleavage system protein R [Pseudomonadales bacterium]
MNTTSPRENYLVISAIGTDRPGIVNELAKVSSENNCNIVDSRMTVLGGEFAIVMMVSGNWDSIAKMENAVASTAEKLGLQVHIKQTQPRSTKQSIAYSVQVVSLDHPGIVHEIAGFFTRQQINIEDLQTGTYCAPHTGTQMFNLDMRVNIPTDTHLPSLREEFMMFCDDRNLDAMIEPARSV